MRLRNIMSVGRQNAHMKKITRTINNFYYKVIDQLKK